MISISMLILEFCIKAFCKDVLSTDIIESLDIFLIMGFTTSFIIDVFHSEKLKTFRYPLLAGYLFRIVLLFWDIYGRSIFVLPNSGMDSEMFYGQSILFMNTGETSRGLFPKVMGSIMTIVGPSRLFIQFIAVLFSVVSLVLLAYMMHELLISETVKRNVCCIVALLPNLSIISSLFLRESILSMFIVISFYIFYLWFKGGNILLYFSAFALAFVASAFHSGCAAIAVGYIAILLLYDRQNNVFKMKVKNIVPAVLMLLVISFLYVNYGDVLFGKMNSIESISDVAEDQDRGASSYVQYVGNSNNPINMIIFTIPRIFFFIASPLPIQWRGLNDIIAFCFSSLFFISVAWYTIRFIASGKKENRTLVIALSIVVFSTFFVFGWGVANAGTACRHRDKITFICGLLLALSYMPKKEYRKLKEKNKSNETNMLPLR